MRGASTADTIAAAFAAVAGRPGDALARATRSPRTWLNYAAALGRFEGWCAAARRHGDAGRPSRSFRAWLLELASSGRSVNTIRQYASAVIVAHRMREQPAATASTCARC